MPLLNENAAVGLARNAPFQQGVSNTDNGVIAEKGILIGWSSSPAGSYVYYDCSVGVMLDSGIVVHNRLPQVNNAADTLAPLALDDPKLDQFTGLGVNLKCKDQYTDIVQRMGHSRYWFRLWGRAMRVGYQVPIPQLKTIGGVAAIPYDRNPQWGVNAIVPGGNYGGVILWRAVWSLWFTTAAPPSSNAIPAVDPSAHISGTIPPPAAMQAPFSRPDDLSQPASPAVLQPKLPR